MVSKPWYMSTTIRIAIVQALIGFLSAVLLGLQHGFTSDTIAAFSVGIKGIWDLRQRFLTTQPIDSVVDPQIPSATTL